MFRSMTSCWGKASNCSHIGHRRYAHRIGPLPMWGRPALAAASVAIASASAPAGTVKLHHILCLASPGRQCGSRRGSHLLLLAHAVLRLCPMAYAAQPTNSSRASLAAGSARLSVGADTQGENLLSSGLSRHNTCPSPVIELAALSFCGMPSLSPDALRSKASRYSEV
jgi:hypothetical protein